MPPGVGDCIPAAGFQEPVGPSPGGVDGGVHDVGGGGGGTAAEGVAGGSDCGEPRGGGAAAEPASGPTGGGAPAAERSDLTAPQFEQPITQGSFSVEHREHVQRSGIGPLVPTVTLVTVSVERRAYGPDRPTTRP